MDDDYEAIDDQVRRVAAGLPFPVMLEADMGGTFVLQVDLGSRGGPDDEHDRAGIDPEADATWWVESGGGAELVESKFGHDADPAVVAQWVATEARRLGSPAATSPRGVAAAGFGVPAAGATGQRASATRRPAADDRTAAPELGR